MTSDNRAGPAPHALDRIRGAVIVLLAICLAACSETETNDVPETSGNASAAAAGGGGEQAGETGNFEISGTSYPFRVIRCDLTGQVFEGMILQGAGTTPDGRSIAVSVDRTGSDMITENAFISIGPRGDGERWSAIRTGLQDGRWFADEGATEPAAGPLIETSGNGLSVTSRFHRQSNGTSEDGVLRATCPS